MRALLIFIFLLICLAAAAFAVWPLLRRTSDTRAQRAVLAGAVTLLVLGLGGGLYLTFGSPGLALRSLSGPSVQDVPGLVSALAERVHKDPNDARAWEMLGRGYLMFNDPSTASEAAGAFRRAILLTPPQEQGPLLSAYGEALVAADNGEVPDQALAAFQSVLALDPKDPAARYYTGLALAERRQTDKALAIWQQVLDEAPPGAPYRGLLIDRIARLRAGAMMAGQSGPPNIAAMVAKLAGELKAAPDNPAGWQRLIRAYAVLGETGKAKQALSDARAALKSDPAGLAGVEAEAKARGVGN